MENNKILNEESVQEIAQKIFLLFTNFGIDAKAFSLSVQVDNEYYETIKENFSIRGLNDYVFTVVSNDWDIRVNKPLTWRRAATDES